MCPEEAGAVLAQLFDVSGGDVVDLVSVSPREALFTTADSEYNQELQVLEALLDQGLPAPRFAAPGRVGAGACGGGGCVCVCVGGGGSILWARHGVDR